MSYINLTNFQNLRMGNFIKPSVSIDRKLNNHKTTVRDLLIEPEILQELRNQNQKLINFFDKEKIKELINYIIIEPTIDDHVNGHLIPFTASEVLNCEEPKIIDHFLEYDEDCIDCRRNDSNVTAPDYGDINIPFDQLTNEDISDDDCNSVIENKKIIVPTCIRIDLFDHLMSYLFTDKELNYVLVGYFSKALSFIILRKPYKIIPYLFTERESVLERLVYHSYRKSISHVLSRILLFENHDEMREREESINYDSYSKTNIKKQPEYDFTPLKPKRLELIRMLIGNINFEENNTEKIDNIIALLTDLIDIKSVLMEIVDDVELIACLCKQLQFNTNSKDSFEVRYNYSQLICFMIKLINNVINFGCQLPQEEIMQDDDDDNDNNSTQGPISHTILSKAIASILPYIIDNFNIPHETPLPSFEATYMKQCQILGNHRVKIMELIASLFTYYKCIPLFYDKILINSSFFPDALSHLIKFEWNNMYQLYFSLLFKNYLNVAKRHVELNDYLFDKLKLLNMITNAISDESFKFQSTNTIKHGYHSFLISLSYKINTIGGGNALFIPNHSREGSICFINKSHMIDNISSITQLSNPNPTPIVKAVSPPVVDICDSVHGYLNESWNDFFQSDIGQTVQLYETRLCEKSFCPDLNDSVHSEEIKEEEANDNINNPFPSKDDLIFGTSDTPQEKVEGNNNYDMNSFEFIDNTAAVLKNAIYNNNMEEDLKVDELDVGNYNDFCYWKDIPKGTKEDYDKLLKDLE